MAAVARVRALDWLRGIVMVLMTVDHTSDWLNAGRFFTDGALFWKPGTPIPAAQFTLRWITHLCAPTFVFLAGVSLSLSNRRRRAQGDSERSLDRALFTRGLFIAALDPLWMSPALMEGHGIVLQVMYAIGFSMLLMVALRRLPRSALGFGALAFFMLSELCVGLALRLAAPGGPSVLSALLLTGARYPMALGPLQQFIIGYPVLHWLAIMALGHACADWLSDTSRGSNRERGLLAAGIGALASFALVRGFNGYGNMGLLHDDDSLLEWLHVSKYPPSLTYLTLELGIMALLLAGLIALERHWGDLAAWLKWPLSKLELLGQTALFFYVLHVHLVAIGALSLGVVRQGGIPLTFVGTACAVIVLYFVCVPYRRYKSANPDGWARYL